MRGTIHIVPARDYWALAAAIREDARKSWLSATRHQFSEAEMAGVAQRVEQLLADGPRRRKDLIAELGVTSTMWNGAGALGEPAPRATVRHVGPPVRGSLRPGRALAPRLIGTRPAIKAWS